MVIVIYSNRKGWPVGKFDAFFSSNRINSSCYGKNKKIVSTKHKWFVIEVNDVMMGEGSLYFLVSCFRLVEDRWVVW